MSQSERLQRYKENKGFAENEDEALRMDENLESRILLLLNHPDLDEYGLLDAYYYDFSVIPDDIRERYNLCRDVYLIYGITNQGEIVSKWVERYDLDSNDPIEDGKVIHKPHDPTEKIYISEISQSFNKDLLSIPISEFPFLKNLVKNV